MCLSCLSYVGWLFFHLHVDQAASGGILDIQFLKAHCSDAQNTHHPAGHHAISKQLPAKMRGRPSAKSFAKKMEALQVSQSLHSYWNICNVSVSSLASLACLLQVSCSNVLIGVDVPLQCQLQKLQSQSLHWHIIPWLLQMFVLMCRPVNDHNSSNVIFRYCTIVEWNLIWCTLPLQK